MSNYRQRQMEKHLQREISRIIREQFKDNDFKMLSVTHVDVSPDYREATVHVSHIEKDEETREKTLKLLKRRDQAIRERLAKDLDLKHIPELRFREDTSIKEAAEVTDIIQELEEEREQRNREQGDT